MFCSYEDANEHTAGERVGARCWCCCHEWKNNFSRLRQGPNSWVTIGIDVGSMLHSIHIHYYYLSNVSHICKMQRRLHDRRRETERQCALGDGPPSTAQCTEQTPKCNSIFIGVDFFLVSVGWALSSSHSHRRQIFLGCSDSGAFKLFPDISRGKSARGNETRWNSEMLNDNMKIMIKIIDSVLISRVRESRFISFSSHRPDPAAMERVIDVIDFRRFPFTSHRFASFARSLFANIFSIFIMCVLVAGKYFDSKYNFIFSDIVCATLAAVSKLRKCVFDHSTSSNCLHSAVARKSMRKKEAKRNETEWNEKRSHVRSMRCNTFFCRSANTKQWN